MIGVRKNSCHGSHVESIRSRQAPKQSQEVRLVNVQFDKCTSWEQTTDETNATKEMRYVCRKDSAMLYFDTPRKPYKYASSEEYVE